MKNKALKHIKKGVCTILCAALAFGAAATAFHTPDTVQAAEYGYDEYGNPIVTATPTPDPHTEYYNRTPESDTITEWPAGPKIEAQCAILMDMTTGAVLYAKSADQAMYPASITKIMTTLLACENLDMNGTITMSQSAAYGITESQSSSIYADTGETFTMEQAIMAVMLQSANEMTLALAEATSGSVKKFVELMNQKARQLGCTNTHFNNPHGLPDPLHYTTARDMAKIAQAAWLNPTFRRFASSIYYEIPPTNKFAETRYLLNHHKMMKGGAYAYDGVLGGKTGYTKAAGNTLVTFASRGNLHLVSVVLNSINGAYADTASLLDYGFNNFTRTAVQTDPAEITTRSLPAEKYLLKDYASHVIFKRTQTPSVTLPNGIGVDRLTPVRRLKKNPAGLPLLDITYNFNGYQVGTARYYQQSLLSDWLIAG